MSETLDQACQALKAALKVSESPKTPWINPKGRTLYIVSSEAQELRRMDSIYAESRRF